MLSTRICRSLLSVLLMCSLLAGCARIGADKVEALLPESLFPQANESEIEDLQAHLETHSTADLLERYNFADQWAKSCDLDLVTPWGDQNVHKLAWIMRSNGMDPTLTGEELLADEEYPSELLYYLLKALAQAQIYPETMLGFEHDRPTALARIGHLGDLPLDQGKSELWVDFLSAHMRRMGFLTNLRTLSDSEGWTSAVDELIDRYLETIRERISQSTTQKVSKKMLDNTLRDLSSPDCLYRVEDTLRGERLRKRHASVIGSSSSSTGAELSGKRDPAFSYLGTDSMAGFMALSAAALASLRAAEKDLKSDPTLWADYRDAFLTAHVMRLLEYHMLTLFYERSESTTEYLAGELDKLSAMTEAAGDEPAEYVAPTKPAGSSKFELIPN